MACSTLLVLLSCFGHSRCLAVSVLHVLKKHTVQSEHRNSATRDGRRQITTAQHNSSTVLTGRLSPLEAGANETNSSTLGSNSAAFTSLAWSEKGVPALLKQVR
jgi:hypothetical protein